MAAGLPGNRHALYDHWPSRHQSQDKEPTGSTPSAHDPSGERRPDPGHGSAFVRSDSGIPYTATADTAQLEKNDRFVCRDSVSRCTCRDRLRFLLGRFSANSRAPGNTDNKGHPTNIGVVGVSLYDGYGRCPADPPDGVYRYAAIRCCTIGFCGNRPAVRPLRSPTPWLNCASADRRNNGAFSRRHPPGGIRRGPSRSVTGRCRRQLRHRPRWNPRFEHLSCACRRSRRIDELRSAARLARRDRPFKKMNRDADLHDAVCRRVDRTKHTSQTVAQ